MALVRRAVLLMEALLVAIEKLGDENEFVRCCGLWLLGVGAAGRKPG